MRFKKIKILEKFFEMESGYVLNFSNRTFYEFFWKNFGINIYDEKYSDNGESKARRLRSFWSKESNELVANSVDKMIDYWEADSLINKENIDSDKNELVERCKEIANNLRKRVETNTQREEDEFLKIDFKSVNIKSLKLTTNMETVIQQRLNEIEGCLNNDIVLGAMFLIGSTLEGLLIDFAKQHPAKFNKANAAPKDSNGNIKKLRDWTLSSLIDVAYEIGYISLDIKKYSYS